MTTTPELHIRQAEHNEGFLKTLDLDKTHYLDWAVTIAFYIAVHYVDALLGSKGLDPGDHDQRKDCINRISELKPFYRHYSQLFTDSRQARYECWMPNTDDVQKAISQWLDPIRVHVKSVLGA